VRSIPRSPSRRTTQPGDGQVRCRPRARMGGGPVVVRAEERSVHGEGSSKSTADVYGRSGGCVGEYRRSGSRTLLGGTTGTEDPNQAVPGGLSDPPGPYGEPVAVKADFTARRVREAVRGNGPVERSEPRPGPTSQHSPAAPVAPTAAARQSHSPTPQRGRPAAATRSSRRPHPRVRARRMACPSSRHPQGPGPSASDGTGTHSECTTRRGRADGMTRSSKECWARRLSDGCRPYVLPRAKTSWGLGRCR
jgi:hypothetical protein